MNVFNDYVNYIKKIESNIKFKKQRKNVNCREIIS